VRKGMELRKMESSEGVRQGSGRKAMGIVQGLAMGGCFCAVSRTSVVVLCMRVTCCSLACKVLDGVASSWGPCVCARE
jgi:hypothetical protein